MLNLIFAKHNIFYYVFFLFFLIIDSCFLIPAVITQSFNPTAELIFPKGIPTTEAKAEIKAKPVIVEAQIIKCLK